MNKNFNTLIKKLNQIKEFGWIASSHNNAQGVLLEKLLGKPIENFEIPDFEGIEIKTHIDSSQSYITLFNANPEGEEFFEINRLCKLYGYPDSILKKVNIIQGNVKATEKSYIGVHHKYRIYVNYKKKKIILYVYNRNNKIIDTKSYWNFKILEEKLYRKLKFLAYITFERKVVNKQIFFRYKDITFYQLKNFDEFLRLIEKGSIIITFTVGVFRCGKRKGQLHNHGTAFRILPKHIDELFTKLY